MPDVEKRLENIEEKIDTLTKAVSAMAVQDEKLMYLTQQVSALWNKYDRLMDSDGIIAKLRDHQASCPKDQLKWMWVVLIPLSLSLFGIGIAMIELYIKLKPAVEALNG